MLVFYYIFFLFSNFSFSQVNLIDYKGVVYYRENSLANWQVINSTPFLLNQGSAIRTEEGGIANLVINNNSTAIVYEDTAIEIETVSIYYVVFGLVYGKTKLNISFPLKSTFLLKTITSNFTTRRILGVFESDLYGRAQLCVGLGEAKFEYRIPHKTGRREFIITQGMFFGVEGPESPYSIRVLTKEEEEKVFEDFDIDYKNRISKRMQTIKKLSSFSSYSYKIAERYNSDYVREKNSDFEKGRTLRDINGNLVRIEQKILRPSQNEIQFINIIKRPDYKDYSNTTFTNNLLGFKYKGGGITNRTDFFAATFYFDKPLPANILRLPSFFSDSNLNPSWATFVAANISSNNSFFIAEVYKYNNSRGELINNTDVVGVLPLNNDMDRDVVITGKIDKSFLKDIVSYNFVEKNISSPTGEIKRKTDGIDISGAFWGLRTYDSFKIDGDIYRIRGDKYLKGGVGNDYFWVNSENYVISAAGALRKKDSIENNYNLFSDILRNNFIQTIFYIKQDNSGITDNSYENIDDNIDLVIGGEVVQASFENIYEGVRRWKN